MSVVVPISFFFYRKSFLASLVGVSYRFFRKMNLECIYWTSFKNQIESFHRKENEKETFKKPISLESNWLEGSKKGRGQKAAVQVKILC